MDEQYTPKDIEENARQFWQKQQSFVVTEDQTKPKYYCLAMFPYPSGKLHMGHVRNYTIADVIGRYQRMLGKNVLQPMGWDAFGLPAENAAIKNNASPAQWTRENIQYMKTQLQQLGFAYDWDREFATCDSDYYRWEQWFFTRLMEKGLVYKQESDVNWCPHDQTVLANEQVIDGCCWRCDNKVERRKIPQWFIRITQYAEELLQDLAQLDEWPEQVRTMQANWIGRSEGAEIKLKTKCNQTVSVYTTRPDTFMGVTYLAVAPQHPLALQAAEKNDAIAQFIQQQTNIKVAEADIATMEKEGIDSGISAIHPITGESLPIWIANFVLMNYGSGAVMSVPGHDQRDWEFAKKYHLPIKQVITSADNPADVDITEAAYTEKGTLINSAQFDNLSSEQAFDAIVETLQQQGAGNKKVNYRLRDWGVSRQRYWGTPIPVINCDKCGPLPVPADQLPVLLPENIAFDGVGSPIKKMPEFYQTTCPSCGGDAHRETDTFDTFMESSWYFARYASHDNKDAMLDERAKYWMPVDQYVGGIEHAILHLLYARFFNKLLRDEGLLNNSEPFTRLLCQGMVVAETFYTEDAGGHKEYVAPQDIDKVVDDKGRTTSATLKGSEQPIVMGGITKMSKSKNNGVDPQSMIDQFGADTVRLFIMSDVPPDQSLEWNDAALGGAHRFLKSLWKLIHQHLQQPAPPQLVGDKLTAEQQTLRCHIHETIEKVSDDYSRRQTFNTGISAIRQLFNSLNNIPEKKDQWLALEREGIEVIIQLLAPITPHVCHYFWEALGHNTPIINTHWPKADPNAMIQTDIEMVVQVNGKVRAKLTVPADSQKDELETLALNHESVQKFTEGKTVRKVIVVPNKLISIVAN